MSIISAYIVPHPPMILNFIGHGREKEIQKTIDAFNEVADEIAKIKPDTIILTSPHSIMYSDYIHISPGKSAEGDLKQFGVPDYTIKVNYDEQLADTIQLWAKNDNIRAGKLGERDPKLDHATIVPLDFINKKYQNYKLVRIGLSGLSPLEHYRFGKCIKNAVNMLDRKVVFIASGDLSHKLKTDGPYGYAAEGPEFDKEVTEAMGKADFLKFLNFGDVFCEKAAECGLRSFQIMAGALDSCAVEPRLLSYEGPFGVGYGVASFKVTAQDDNRRFDIMLEMQEQQRLEKIKQKQDPYVKLARETLETYIKTGKIIDVPTDLPKEMLENAAGAFVSLKKFGRLRGCIGTISAVEPFIAKEIIRNAISAGCNDPRFSPVESNELQDIEYSVDILGQAESIDSKDKLDVKEYGVIVTNGGRRGLLLPNLEGVDTVDDQITIAKQKAGIRQDEPCKLQRFRVVRHK